MTSEQFGKTYLQHEQDIANVLRKQRIYDEDLLHDTYIALYCHSRNVRIIDFVNTFVSFYRARYKRRDDNESAYIVCDNATLIEHFDRPDESDLDYREHVGQRIDELMERFIARHLPGERNHKQAVKMLQLYLSGLTFEQIARRMNMSKQSVQQLFRRTVEKLRVTYCECERTEDEC